MGIHSSILVWPLHRTGRTRGHLWTQTSGCPLLHPGPTACVTTGWTRGMSGLRQMGVHSSILVRQLAPLLVRPGACLDLDEWVSTPPSWSNGLHPYSLDQRHVWTWMNGYPLLHPGPTPAQDWSDQGASLNSDK